MSLIRENGFKLTLTGVDADINRAAWDEIVAQLSAIMSLVYLPPFPVGVVSRYGRRRYAPSSQRDLWQ